MTTCCLALSAVLSERNMNLFATLRSKREIPDPLALPLESTLRALPGAGRALHGSVATVPRVRIAFMSMVRA